MKKCTCNHTKDTHAHRLYNYTDPPDFCTLCNCSHYQEKPKIQMFTNKPLPQVRGLLGGYQVERKDT